MLQLVSAIVSTYNRPVDIVKRAVESVIKQTYSNLEIIVVNDCPEKPELSQEIGTMLHELDNRIVYILHDCNRGACAARNTGLQQARGTFVAFLDDDDEWLSNKIEKQVAFIGEVAGLVYCDDIRYKGDNHYIHCPNPAHEEPLKAILMNNFIGSTSFPLMRTDMVRTVGCFDEHLVSCQDYDLWIRMVEKYPIVYVHEALICYYISSDSTYKHSNIKYIEGDRYILEKYKYLYDQYPDEYLFHLNDIALNALFVKRDFKMYWIYKKLALNYRTLHPYNLFFFIIKLKKKYFKAR